MGNLKTICDREHILEIYVISFWRVEKEMSYKHGAYNLYMTLSNKPFLKSFSYLYKKKKLDSIYFPFKSLLEKIKNIYSLKFQVNHALYLFLQVTEKNAKILIDAGFNCHLKGMTLLKGKGEIVTYMVTPS